MSPDVVRWVVAVLVFAHGVGHVLFAPMLSGTMKLDASGHSWLLTGALGDGPTRAIASLFALVVTVAFAVAAGGIVLQTTWWRGLAIGAAIGSIALVAVMWDGLPSNPAAAAVAFDVVVLGALFLARWPSHELIGA
jgi:hypothetical protein